VFSFFVNATGLSCVIMPVRIGSRLRAAGGELNLGADARCGSFLTWKPRGPFVYLERPGSKISEEPTSTTISNQLVGIRPLCKHHHSAR
jgi:hypothetical protein